MLALMKGRLHLSTEDVDAVAPAVLRHRIILNFDAHAKGRRRKPSSATSSRAWAPRFTHVPEPLLETALLEN